jgi:hypothetical protein
VQVAVIVSGCLVLFAYPEVRDYARVLRNPTSLPHNYTANVAVVVGVVCLVTAILAARRWRWMAAVTAVAAIGLVAAAWSGPSAVAKPPVLGTARDVYDGDIGDPFILREGSRYVVVGTDDPPDHIPVATSPDLAVWQRGPDAVPVLPPWANPDRRRSLTWAPTVLSTARGYLLYISVQEAASRRQCIAVLSASTATGPYVDALGAPLVCQRQLGGSIDPSVVSAGGLHLLWKSDGNCCGLGLAASIWEQDLRPDGVAVTGQPHRLLNADRPWQGGIIENPAMIPASGGGWWLFYSGNRFDVAAYATGLAWCAHLAGPCRETSANPFLSGTGSQYSPGGLDFFRAADGSLWASFATWNRPPRNGQFYCCRSVNVAPVLSA